MIDFSPITNKKINWTRFGMQFCPQDLADQTNWLTDQLLDLLSDATDADVVFEPVDPEAHDPYAENPEDENLGWNLAHVIVHITASNEESAFLAAELARGVEVEPRRSRWEVDWETVTTIEQVRQRLEESRRFLLASLEMWPDQAHTQNFYKNDKGLKITPMVRFLLGQNHAMEHLEQIKEILRQAKNARG
ncbi:MAG: DinB family protein [Anaerolineales bacterium]|nr:DinB family protein [Anaerolineales bacterium]